jgi:hypothetical protein
MEERRKVMSMYGPPMRQEPQYPAKFKIGDDLNWGAPWINVCLWVELPFWLMVENATIPIEIAGHTFSVSAKEEYFELYCAEIMDSRQNVCYRGPLKKEEDLSVAVREVHEKNPNMPFMWRKSKTVLKVETRCNEDVWAKALSDDERRPAVQLYLNDLCRAHIPVVNKLIQAYRLLTYDHFAFEVSPWDVPIWTIERGGCAVSSVLVPYRAWDHKPLILRAIDKPAEPYKLINGADLGTGISTLGTPGEFDLMDSLNLMERGDYSGAVRRISTAIEAVVAGAVFEQVEASEGKQNAESFLSQTQMDFNRRIEKYEQLSKRIFPKNLKTDLAATRKLRNRIVHQAFRISSGERGLAQRSVDTGRWTFNWFENDAAKTNVREKRIAFRSPGRDVHAGIFPTKITQDGVDVCPIPG